MEPQAPPHSIEAELSVIGCLLLGKPEAIDTAAEMITVEDFYRPLNAVLFGVILKLHREQEAVDVVTVKAAALPMTVLTDLELRNYLMELSGVQFSTANVASYAGIVLDCSKRRRLAEIARDVHGRAYTERGDVAALIGETEAAVMALRDGASPAKTGEDLNPILADTMDRLDDMHHGRGKVVGVMSGFPGLDYLTGGFPKSGLSLIAGRPGMAKTGLASQLFMEFCKSGLSAVFASAEMSREQLGHRIVCCESRVNGQNVRNGQFSTEEWARLQNGVERLWDGRGHIDDKSAPTVDHLRMICRRHKARAGRLDALLVDYIGLMGCDTKRRAAEGNRNLEISEMSAALLAIAKDFDIAVIALSQLSRAVEHRQDKRPMISDLRDSGSLEQDASIILFPFREAYYDSAKAHEDKTRMEDAELILAKHRMGATGTVMVGFIPAYVRFENIQGFQFKGAF